MKTHITGEYNQAPDIEVQEESVDEEWLPSSEENLLALQAVNWERNEHAEKVKLSREEQRARTQNQGIRTKSEDSH